MFILGNYMICLNFIQFFKLIIDYKDFSNAVIFGSVPQDWCDVRTFVLYSTVTVMSVSIKISCWGSQNNSLSLSSIKFFAYKKGHDLFSSMAKVPHAVCVWKNHSAPCWWVVIQQWKEKKNCQCCELKEGTSIWQRSIFSWCKCIALVCVIVYVCSYGLCGYFCISTCV